jgi:hypothetical protein
MKLYILKNKNKLNNVHSHQNHDSPVGTVCCQPQHNLHIKKCYQDKNTTIQ